MAYIVDVLTLTAVLVIAVHGYMLIKGLGGMLHLGHAVFYGLGAYTSAILATTVLPQGSFPISLLAGSVVAGIGALLIGWPALRERGRYFMIVTFAIQLIFVTLVINLNFTGGPDGITSIPRMSLGPWRLTPQSTLSIGSVSVGVDVITLALILLFACASFAFCHFIIRSPFGRLVRATREDELAVEAYGRRTVPVKMAILLIGAAVTGAAGSIFAHYFLYVGPFQYELELVILFLMMLIVGGQYNLVGATVGTVLIMLLLEFLRYLLEDVLTVPFEVTAHLRKVVYASVLILVLVVRPSGLFPERFIRYSRSKTAKYPLPGAELTTVTALHPSARQQRLDAAHQRNASAVLSCRGLSKHFGGLMAVDKCEFELMEGKIVAIIGPNGAGKTTLFNLVSGFLEPDVGQVYFGTMEITTRGAAAIAQLGIARTFQDVRIWGRLTVLENILAAMPRHPGENPLRLFISPRKVRSAETENIERAWSLLERFGMEAKANDLAQHLSYAQRKMLSLARLSAFRPTTMLLDEPTAGVDLRRLDTFLNHIRTFSVSEKCSVCLIEHNMDVVRELADWVLFMDEGKIVSAGLPNEVLGDRQLMNIYLGQGNVGAN
jgi:branched-chain amino acid transport system ATP-binding protein/branched-chain amino acid transport system permease protein